MDKKQVINYQNKNGLTKNHMAEKLGVSFSTYHRFITTENPQSRIVNKYCKILGIKNKILFDDDEILELAKLLNRYEKALKLICGINEGLNSFQNNGMVCYGIASKALNKEVWINTPCSQNGKELFLETIKIKERTML